MTTIRDGFSEFEGGGKVGVGLGDAVGDVVGVGLPDTVGDSIPDAGGVAS